MRNRGDAYGKVLFSSFQIFNVLVLVTEVINLLCF